MRLIDAFRSLPERKAMRKRPCWAVVYGDEQGQWLGCFWSSREIAAERALWAGNARFIIKVTPK